MMKEDDGMTVTQLRWLEQNLLSALRRNQPHQHRGATPTASGTGSKSALFKPPSLQHCYSGLRKGTQPLLLQHPFSCEEEDPDLVGLSVLEQLVLQPLLERQAVISTSEQQGCELEWEGVAKARKGCVTLWTSWLSGAGQAYRIPL